MKVFFYLLALVLFLESSGLTTLVLHKEQVTMVKNDDGQGEEKKEENTGKKSDKQVPGPVFTLHPVLETSKPVAGPAFDPLCNGYSFLPSQPPEA